MVDVIRNETPHERLDRLWVDQLQELRVMQTGVQLLGGSCSPCPSSPRSATSTSCSAGCSSG